MMIPVRNFYEELREENFKRITYGIFNRMYDEGIIDSLEHLYKEPLSIEDFKYFDFELNDKEKFLLKMYNREYLKNIKNLKIRFINKREIVLYINHEEGLIRIVKLNKIVL